MTFPYPSLIYEALSNVKGWTRLWNGKSHPHPIMSGRTLLICYPCSVSVYRQFKRQDISAFTEQEMWLFFHAKTYLIMNAID